MDHGPALVNRMAEAVDGFETTGACMHPVSELKIVDNFLGELFSGE